MNLHEIQRMIEKIYRLPKTFSVTQYLINASQAKAWVENGLVRPQVLIQKDEEGYLLGVHLEEKTVQDLESKKPKKISLETFCSAAEEISHFRYLIWSITNERPVSLLDLELQGEIDKFLLASIYFQKDEKLFERLFEKISFDERLPQEQRKRYEEANRLGGKFCKAFQKGKQLWKELRQFYRQTSPFRLSYVHNL